MCVCVCNLAVICLIIPFRSMDFDGENMAFYFWAYLNYTLVTLVITELFTKFLFCTMLWFTGKILEKLVTFHTVRL